MREDAEMPEMFANGRLTIEEIRRLEPPTVRLFGEQFDVSKTSDVSFLGFTVLALPIIGPLYLIGRAAAWLLSRRAK